MILGASPALLEVDSFADLASVIDIAGPLRNTDHARWRSLTTRPDMRFIGIALPRLLARPPWEDDGTRADGFRYAEYAPTSEERVWMSAGYAFASVVARAFANYAWPADVRGVETDRVGGGLVEGMPLEPFRTDPHFVWNRAPVEIVWNDHQERALLDAGTDAACRDSVQRRTGVRRRAQPAGAATLSPVRPPPRPTPTRGCRRRSIPSCARRASPTT